jgi:hypothetical protein
VIEVMEWKVQATQDRLDIPVKSEHSTSSHGRHGSPFGDAGLAANARIVRTCLLILHRLDLCASQILRYAVGARERYDKTMPAFREPHRSRETVFRNDIMKN